MKRAPYLYAERPQHPLARKDGSVAVARGLLYDRLGPGPHPCHWCGVLADWHDGLGKCLTADHVNFDRLDNSAKNIVPACWSCNSKRQRGSDRPYHGTLRGYTHRACRCEPCREAGRAYRNARKQALHPSSPEPTTAA